MRGCGNGVLETQVGFLFFFFFEIPLAGRRKMTAGITKYMVKKSVRIRAPTRAQIHYPCFPIPLAYYEYSTRTQPLVGRYLQSGSCPATLLFRGPMIIRNGFGHEIFFKRNSVAR